MPHLDPGIVSVSSLSTAQSQRMFALYSHYYGGTSEALFLTDLAEKDLVILLHDENGTLQGFSTVRIMAVEFDGVPCRAVYSGDTIVSEPYWGQLTLAFTWIRLTGALQAQAPNMPLYWFLLVKGHRTYRFLRAFYRRFYPSYNWETPGTARAHMALLARQKFGDAYQADRGVVHFSESRGHLKDPWATVPEKDRQNPDVRFFLERNPGYVHGDELVCLAELTQTNHRILARRLFQEGMEMGLNAMEPKT